MDRSTISAKRKKVVHRFVRTHFGVCGTLRLHRSAFGFDLLKAPANVLLAPVFLVVRLTALLARAVRLRSLSDWLMRRRVLLETNVSRHVAAQTITFISDLDRQGLGVNAPLSVIERNVADYAGVRSAVAEITTTALLLIAGYIVFQSATPGVISLAGPIAELRAHALAVEQFPLGQGLGRMYYGVFSTDLTIWRVVATGVMLSMLASIVTTFAGVVVDPLQVLIGTHRRRLMRLLDRLDKAAAIDGGLAREHVTARLADLSDIAVSVWRMLRGS